MKLTFELEVDDALAVEIRGHWEQGTQVILSPAHWRSFDESPPVALGNGDPTVSLSVG